MRTIGLFALKTTSLPDRLTSKFGVQEQIVGLRAFLSRRIVTPQGIRPGAILVDGERIRDVVAENDVPAHASREDFGNEALLVDWDAWGGLVRNNQKEIPALARMNTLLRKISRAAPRAR